MTVTQNLKTQKCKDLSLDKYLDVIRPCFKQMINNFIACNDTEKNQVTLKLLFISSEDTGEERDLYLGSKNIAVIAGSNINNLLKFIFKQFF